MNRQQHANLASSTLSVAAAIGDTSITLTDASKFPASGNFTILCDSEIMLATARSGNVLTVRRGQESTTAAAHSLGVTATQILTAGSIDRWLRDSVPGAGANSSRPPLALRSSAGVDLTSADFTAINTTNATIVDQDGAIVLRKLGNASRGDDVAALSRPYAAPATLIAGLRLCLPLSVSSGFPLGLAGFADASNHLLFHHIVNVASGGGANYQAARYTSPTVAAPSGIVVAALPIVLPSDVVWFKCEDDNTNLKLSISNDGVNWVQMYSEARNAFLSSPNQFIFGANSYGNGADILVTCVSWKEG